MWVNVDMDLEILANIRNGQHRRRWSGNHDGALIDEVERVAVLCCEVEVVECGKGGDTECPYKGEELKLVLNIKVIGWFIEDEELRVLGEGACYEDALFLAS